MQIQFKLNLNCDLRHLAPLLKAPEYCFEVLGSTFPRGDPGLAVANIESVFDRTRFRCGTPWRWEKNAEGVAVVVEFTHVPELIFGFDDLSFDSTVPRTVVHRAAVSEVFVTDSVAAGNHKYLVAAHLPRRHAFFGDGFDGKVDPMLCLEVTRQSCVLVAHEYYDVPIGWQFVMTTSSFEVLSQVALTELAQWSRPLIDVLVTGREPARGVPNVLRVVATFLIGDQPAIRFTGGLVAVDSSIYQQMRRSAMSDAPTVPGSQEGTPLPGRLVGRGDPRNVVLSASRSRRGADFRADFRADMIVDTDHPVFFDHPLDHVPGTLLVEAHRQVGAAALVERAGWAEPKLSSVEVSFDSFCELNVPTPVTATVLATGENEAVVRTEISQSGLVLSATTMRFVR